MIIKNLFNNIVQLGGVVGRKVTVAATAASKSKRFWTLVFTAGLTSVNKSLHLVDDTTLNEIIGLAVAAVLSDSLRPFDEVIVPTPAITTPSIPLTSEPITTAVTPEATK